MGTLAHQTKNFETINPNQVSHERFKKVVTRLLPLVLSATIVLAIAGDRVAKAVNSQDSALDAINGRATADLVVGDFVTEVDGIKYGPTIQMKISEEHKSIWALTYHIPGIETVPDKQTVVRYIKSLNGDIDVVHDGQSINVPAFINELPDLDNKAD